MKAPNLMLHCGGEAVNRMELGQVELPEVTRSYMPVGHDTVVNLVEDSLADVGFRFGVEAHGVAKGGDRYFGLVHLYHGDMNDQHALVVGIRNSLDKSFPAALAFGSCVFVCDNLAFSGEVTVSRKHTTNILRDLPGLVRNAVENTKAMSGVQDERFERYRETKIRGDKFAHDLIIQMLRNGAINTSRVEKVVQEYHEPSFDHGGKTVWRLFNAVTEALKPAPLADMPRRTIELQSTLDTFINFKPTLQLAQQTA